MLVDKEGLRLTWNMAGTMVMASKVGHRSGVPRIESKPRICEMRMEMVMTNWYTVPTAPLRLTGDISAKYIGAKPALRPELIPIKNLPKMMSS